jgi:hypothetical protein
VTTAPWKDPRPSVGAQNGCRPSCSRGDFAEVWSGVRQQAMCASTGLRLERVAVRTAGPWSFMIRSEKVRLLPQRKTETDFGGPEKASRFLSFGVEMCRGESEVGRFCLLSV